MVDCLSLVKDRAARCGAEAMLGALFEVVQACGAIQREALVIAFAPFWEALSGQVQLHGRTLAKLLSALIEVAGADLLLPIAQVIAAQAATAKANLCLLFVPSSAFVLRAKIVVEASGAGFAGDVHGFAGDVHGVVPLATELAGGLSRLSWEALCVPDDRSTLGLISSNSENVFVDSLIDAWLRFMMDMRQHIPTALATAGGEAVSFAATVAGSALANFAVESLSSSRAANARSPPPVVLEFFSMRWDSTPELEQRMRHILLAPASSMPSNLTIVHQTSLGVLALCGLAELSVQKKGAAILARNAVAAADGFARIVGADNFRTLAEQACRAHGLQSDLVVLKGGKGKPTSSDRLLRHLATAQSSRRQGINQQ